MPEDYTEMRMSLNLIFTESLGMLEPMAPKSHDEQLPEAGLPHNRSWYLHARTVLDRAGRNRSRVRDRLIVMLASHNCALTAQQLEEDWVDRYQDERPVARATVYRTLELLQEHQLVNRVDVGDGVARYEVANPGGHEHHHHLICEACGGLYPFDDPELERLIGELGDRHGFEIKEHEVTLRGVCPDCDLELGATG
jgi:Fur family transcriptional regulator, ferric uptake regulator